MNNMHTTNTTPITTIHGLALYTGPTAEDPTVYDLDLAKWAGLKNIHDIRTTIWKLIERGDLMPEQYIEVIETDDEFLGSAEKLQADTGRPAKRAYLLTEEGALNVLVCLRTKAAAKARQQIIAVYIAWRRGTLPAYAAPKEETPQLPSVEDKLRVIGYATDLFPQLRGWCTTQAQHVVAEYLTKEPDNDPHRRMLDVDTYLRSRGFTATEAREERSQFGRHLAKTYREVRGREPGKCIRVIDGAEREVNAYTKADTDIFAQTFHELFANRTPKLQS